LREKEKPETSPSASYREGLSAQEARERLGLNLEGQWDSVNWDSAPWGQSKIGSEDHKQAQEVLNEQANNSYNIEWKFND
jgi:hypothetical protein